MLKVPKILTSAFTNHGKRILVGSIEFFCVFFHAAVGFHSFSYNTKNSWKTLET